MWTMCCWFLHPLRRAATPLCGCPPPQAGTHKTRQQLSSFPLHPTWALTLHTRFLLHANILLILIWLWHPLAGPCKHNNAIPTIIPNKISLENFLNDAKILLEEQLEISQDIFEKEDWTYFVIINCNILLSWCDSAGWVPSWKP